MNARWLFGAVLALVLAGCDKKEAPAPAPVEPAALPTPADEAAAKREADERRKQFYGGGKPHYTPQDVKGF